MFTLYQRVDLQSMLEFTDCDPVDSIPISTLPVLPDWVRKRNLEKLGGATHVRIVPPDVRNTVPGEQSEPTRDNRIPQSGLWHFRKVSSFNLSVQVHSNRC